MKLVLEDIANRLRKGDYKNEEHVRVAIVGRLLQQLGWDIWNPLEVNAEFSPVRDEDSSRVDIAVFMPPPQDTRAAIFVEVKAVGKLEGNIDFAERQLRDYNRNNQAEISVLTDGRLWRLYWAAAAGEFKQKLFEKIDLLDPNLPTEEQENTFRTFLSKESLRTGKAVEQARVFLRRTDDQRTMFDVLPIALRDAELDPTSSKVDCFIQRCMERGVICTTEDAKKFILNNRTQSSIPTTIITERLIEPHPEPGPRIQTQESPLRKKLDYSGTLSRTTVLTGKNGTNATGKQLPNGSFVVFSGSIAAAPSPGFIRKHKDDGKGYYGLYKQLIDAGSLIPLQGGNTYKLCKDSQFKSPSAAASVFLGRSANGPKEWK